MNDAEENILSTNERFDQAEIDPTEATDELQSKNKLIRKVEAKLNTEEDENKRCLILIEGVPEKSKLKPREIAGNLLKELGIDFVESDIRTAYRMGQLQNNPKRGRAIKVKFSATYFKQEICKNIVKLKAHIPPEIGFALGTKRKWNIHKNMKYTWPTPAFCVGTQRNLYSTDRRRGLALGLTQFLGLASGGWRRVTQIFTF